MQISAICDCFLRKRVCRVRSAAQIHRLGHNRHLLLLHTHDHFCTVAEVRVRQCCLCLPVPCRLRQFTADITNYHYFSASVCSVQYPLTLAL
jgi:hypothetical protein